MLNPEVNGLMIETTWLFKFNFPINEKEIFSLSQLSRVARKQMSIEHYIFSEIFLATNNVLKPAYKYCLFNPFIPRPTTWKTSL